MSVHAFLLHLSAEPTEDTKEEEVIIKSISVSIRVHLVSLVCRQEINKSARELLLFSSKAEEGDCTHQHQENRGLGIC